MYIVIETNSCGEEVNIEDNDMTGMLKAAKEKNNVTLANIPQRTNRKNVNNLDANVKQVDLVASNLCEQVSVKYVSNERNFR